jgi:hypothetical protein
MVKNCSFKTFRDLGIPPIYLQGLGEEKVITCIEAIL